MLSIKESVEQIKTQINDLIGNDVKDVRLEEIIDDTKNEYNLTISYLVPNINIPETLTTIAGNNIFPFIRQYKNLLIDKENGTIICMKMCNNA